VASAALERAAKAQQQLAGASFLPTIALAADYGFQGTELQFTSDNDFVIGGGAQWNLFSGGRDLARRQSASLERRRTALATEETVVKVEREVLAAVDGCRRRGGPSRRRTTGWRRRGVRSSWSRADTRRGSPRTSSTAMRGAVHHGGTQRRTDAFTYAARLVELERATATRSMSI